MWNQLDKIDGTLKSLLLTPNNRTLAVRCVSGVIPIEALPSALYEFVPILKKRLDQTSGRNRDEHAIFVAFFTKLLSASRKRHPVNDDDEEEEDKEDEDGGDDDDNHKISYPRKKKKKKARISHDQHRTSSATVTKKSYVQRLFQHLLDCATWLLATQSSNLMLWESTLNDMSTKISQSRSYRHALNLQNDRTDIQLHVLELFRESMTQCCSDEDRMFWAKQPSTRSIASYFGKQTTMQFIHTLRRCVCASC